MGKDDLCITVPSFFKCPISLDVMKSPVSLCTGVTYDRSSIQRWLDGGNNTCPATMQVLQTKEIVPNHTLHRLIQMWSDSSPASAPNHHQKPPVSGDSPEIVTEILRGVRDGQVGAVKRVSEIFRAGEKNRDTLAVAGAVEALAGILRVEREMKLLQEAVKALGPILAVRSVRREAEMLTTPEALRSFAAVLDARDDGVAVAECARAVESLASVAECDSVSLIAGNDALVSGLVRTISLSDSGVSSTAVSCMAVIAAPRRTRARIIRLGVVPAVTQFLLRPDSSSSAGVEKAMRVLELASSCAEGRAAICMLPACVPMIVAKLMKATVAATESGVVALWSVCCAFRDKRATEAAARSNGLTKILLLMQSNCSPAVRQMAGDLLKTLRAESKDCLPRYDSKTVHIMPF